MSRALASFWFLAVLVPFRLQGGLRPGQPLGDPEARLDVAGRLERRGSLPVSAVSGVALILHGTGWSSSFLKKTDPGPGFRLARSRRPRALGRRIASGSCWPEPEFIHDHLSHARSQRKGPKKADSEAAFRRFH